MKKVSNKEIEIVQREAKTLRAVAKPVILANIGSAKIQLAIQDMIKTLEKQDDGVAIAAPQINIPFRIFIVSKKVEMLIKGEEEITEKTKQKYKDGVYINPEIKKISKAKKLMDEGCLSIRYAYGKVERAEKVTVVAYDEKGKKFTRGGSGLLAQIFQHEIDHLDGVLFTDKAIEVKEIPPEPKKIDEKK